MVTHDERIVALGYILGMLAREANQKGDIKVSTENIGKILEIYGLDPEMTVDEQLLLEYIESVNFKANMDLGSNRKERREKLQDNKKVYKIG